ncbi:MAG: hypothetical protein GX638_18045 [Crenarchaeota archaeon]|nr:hypothetical protein [Thermoproteota archaeon]
MNEKIKLYFGYQILILLNLIFGEIITGIICMMILFTSQNISLTMTVFAITNILILAIVYIGMRKSMKFISKTDKELNEFIKQ